MSAPKKTLRLKIALIILFSILLPLLSIFITQNPIFILALGSLSAILATFLIIQTLNPLDTLIKGAEGLKDGNLNFRLDIRSGDEFESIANSFNLMAEKLHHSFTNLEQDKNISSAEKNRLSMILSAVLDGIIAVDFSSNVVLANKSAEYITGFRIEEMQGKPLDQFIRIFNDKEELPPKTYLKSQVLNQSLKLVGRDGKQVNINLLASPIPEGVQTNLSSILILHDLTHETEIERMKLDFVSMASHELRTPLTSIIGYLSVFISENKDKLNKDQFDLLTHSLVSSQQLLGLVQNLLNVNKIEKDQLSVSAYPIDYQAVLSKANEDLQNQAKLKNITLTLTSPQAPLPKVLADPVGVAEVINNLVANAINYTSSGGQVTISTSTTPQEITTTISDTGVGIPKEAIPHLFTKFFRVSNDLQQGNKGTGLGLFISKSIITKLNGKIWVDSEVGKGSNFHFSLPVAPSSMGNVESNNFVSQAIQQGVLNYS